MGRHPRTRRCWIGLLVVGMLTPVPAAHAQTPLPTQVPPVCGAPAPTGSLPAPPRQGSCPSARYASSTLATARARAAGRIEAGCTVTLDLATSPVPANASAVALSVTATDAAEPGYVTVFPCGSALPYASNLNPRVGDPTPNLVLVPIDPATRRVCLFTFKATHLVVDLTGMVRPRRRPDPPVTPARLLDTRIRRASGHGSPAGRQPAGGRHGHRAARRRGRCGARRRRGCGRQRHRRPDGRAGLRHRVPVRHYPAAGVERELPGGRHAGHPGDGRPGHGRAPVPVHLRRRPSDRRRDGLVRGPGLDAGRRAGAAATSASFTPVVAERLAGHPRRHRRSRRCVRRRRAAGVAAAGDGTGAGTAPPRSS